MIRSYNVLLVLILVLFSSTTDAQDLKSAKKVVKLMGCGFEVSAISDDENEAWKAVEAGITTVIFDRNGYLYHGRVKALADAARKNGLKL